MILIDIYFKIKSLLNPSNNKYDLIVLFPLNVLKLKLISF